LRESASAPDFADEGMQIDMEVLSPVLKHFGWQVIDATCFVGFETRDG